MRLSISGQVSPCHQVTYNLIRDYRRYYFKINKYCNFFHSGQLQITSDSGNQNVSSTFKDLALVAILLVLAWILYKLHSLQEQSGNAGMFKSEVNIPFNLNYLFALVPIGFIYVQFPDQRTPQELFTGGTAVWSDITVEYAGLFFRAEGGSSEQFEAGEQTQSSPKITEASMVGNMNSLIGTSGTITLPLGNWSNYLWSGHYTSFYASNYYDKFYSMRFFTSGDEVRPKNVSIKIWKRIG